MSEAPPLSPAPDWELDLDEGVEEARGVEEEEEEVTVEVGLGLLAGVGLETEAAPEVPPTAPSGNLPVLSNRRERLDWLEVDGRFGSEPPDAPEAAGGLGRTAAAKLRPFFAASSMILALSFPSFFSFSACSFLKALVLPT